MIRIPATAILLHLALISPANGQDPDTSRIPPTGRDSLIREAEPPPPEDILSPERANRVVGTDTLISPAGSATPGDTLRVEQPLVSADTVFAEEDLSHSPYRAVMNAVVLPGLGQIYNGKIWKVPIVWAAFGVAGYAISFNTGEYRLASEQYALAPDDTNEKILRYWRRNLEVSYIGLIVVYALQVLDAYVDAQLYNWDVNDNLSMRVAPSMQPLLVPASSRQNVYGLTCSIDLRR